MKIVILIRNSYFLAFHTQNSKPQKKPKFQCCGFIVLLKEVYFSVVWLLCQRHVYVYSRTVLKSSFKLKWLHHHEAWESWNARAVTSRHVKTLAFIKVVTLSKECRSPAVEEAFSKHHRYSQKSRLETLDLRVPTLDFWTYETFQILNSCILWIFGKIA